MEGIVTHFELGEFNTLKALEEKFNKLKDSQYFIGNINDRRVPLVGEILSFHIKEKEEKKIYKLLVELKTLSLISNTLIDKHGDKLTKEALEGMCNQINKNGLVVTNGHNKTNPPIGRVIKAKLVDFKEESFLFGDIEIFDVSNIGKNNQEIKYKEEIVNDLEISFDRNFELDEEIVNSVEEFLQDNSELKRTNNIKKSLEFTPEIIVKFAIGAVGAGFFNALGARAYKGLEKVIKDFFKKYPKEEMHLISNNQKELPNGKVITIKNISRLTRDNYNKLFANTREEIIKSFVENQIKEVIKSNKPISLIINKIDEEGQIKFNYSVSESGTPYEIASKKDYENMLNDIKTKETDYGEPAINR